MTDTQLLSLIIFLPTLGAAVLLLPWLDAKAIRWATLLVTLITAGLSVGLAKRYFTASSAADFGSLGKRALMTASDPAAAQLPDDFVTRLPWIKAGSFRIEYYLGVDGISLVLVVLTCVLSALSVIAAFSIEKMVRGFFILFLVLETGMLGCFLALDFFLFFVFWEIMLLPMYFLIGIWGGPRREYAATKFFLYTLLGSVLILIAIFSLYFTSSPNTFDIMRLHELGQLGGEGAPFSATFQITMFVLLVIGFAIKVPVVPFHTWLPDAHVEAPTPISMILAGVLLKFGGYGLIRIAYPIFPYAAYELAPLMSWIAVGCIIYGAFAAMAQTDFKRLVAYSSVSHMGYVTLGIAVLPRLVADASKGFDPNAAAAFYSWGLGGAVFQMVAHGISSAGMFFLVGVIYERAHHRDLNRFGGLMNVMPIYGGLSMVVFFAGMGLPGLCGFVGEVLTVLAGFKHDPAIGIVAALGVILTAAYILWTVQRVFYGVNPQYVGTPEITVRELSAAIPLVLFALALGLYPDLLFRWMGLGKDVAVLASQLAQFGPEALRLMNAGL